MAPVNVTGIHVIRIFCVFNLCAILVQNLKQYNRSVQVHSSSSWQKILFYIILSFQLKCYKRWFAIGDLTFPLAYYNCIKKKKKLNQSSRFRNTANIVCLFVFRYNLFVPVVLQIICRYNCNRNHLTQFSAFTYRTFIISAFMRDLCKSSCQRWYIVYIIGFKCYTEGLTLALIKFWP